ncbi:MAG TPA: amidohydrolase [Thermomicrobiales bacterium]|nr:amidohydrolase [Thermomicrobiales bacterium]
MVTTPNTLKSEIDEILPGVIADRRHLHEHPELGFQEHETAAFVAQRLQTLGVEDIRTGINKTGVTGLIHGTKPGAGKVVLLRADMDALPITEENEVEYVSQNPGVMHACGHDAHTSILLGVARILMEKRSLFSGTVKVLFQPSEELFPGGAVGMIAEGVLEDPHVDAVFGLHMAQESPVGTVLISAGPIMAAPDSFKIDIQGKGGHAARPQAAIDPVVIGSEIVVAIQTLVSRETDPMDNAVVSTTYFNSGDAFNVIPDIASLGGTVRTFKPETRDYMEKRLPELVEGVGAALGAKVEATFTRGYPATVNDPEQAERVRQAAIKVVGEEKVLPKKPAMGGEDFSYFLEQRPGAYFFVGTKNEEKGLIWGHHHPRFDIDEESLGVGIETTVETVFSYLNDEA